MSWSQLNLFREIKAMKLLLPVDLELSMSFKDQEKGIWRNIKSSQDRGGECKPYLVKEEYVIVTQIFDS